MEPALATATITLTPREKNDVKQREVFVSVDGQRFATLAFGDTITREIPAGREFNRL